MMPGMKLLWKAKFLRVAIKLFNGCVKLFNSGKVLHQTRQGLKKPCLFGC